MPYDVVPIIDIPGYGDKAAVTVSDELKIKVRPSVRPPPGG